MKRVIETSLAGSDLGVGRGHSHLRGDDTIICSVLIYCPAWGHSHLRGNDTCRMGNLLPISSWVDSHLRRNGTLTKVGSRRVGRKGVTLVELMVAGDDYGS